MLWVYGHYTFFNAGIDLRRHNLTSIYRRQILTSKVDSRAVRVDTDVDGSENIIKFIKRGVIGWLDFYIWCCLQNLQILRVSCAPWRKAA